MEGKLIKVENGYVLMVNNIMYATDNDKLSLKNCESIANGYDLDELAREACDITDPLRLDSQKYKQDPYFKIGFNKGFQKALEILGDNKFSEDDMRKAINWSWRKTDREEHILITDEKDFIQSLQQTEWDVEIEMEKCGYCEGCNKVGMLHCAHADSCGYPIETERPKLDANGCLILRRC